MNISRISLMWSSLIPLCFIPPLPPCLCQPPAFKNDTHRYNYWVISTVITLNICSSTILHSVTIILCAYTRRSTEANLPPPHPHTAMLPITDHRCPCTSYFSFYRSNKKISGNINLSFHNHLFMIYSNCNTW